MKENSNTFNKKCLNPLVSGQFVRSKAGRDKGVLYLVIDVIDENFVTVCDGDLRKITNPKKKRLKHLQQFKDVIPNFEELKNSSDFNDSKLRTMIQLRKGEEK